MYSELTFNYTFMENYRDLRQHRHETVWDVPSFRVPLSGVVYELRFTVFQYIRTPFYSYSRPNSRATIAFASISQAHFKNLKSSLGSHLLLPRLGWASLHGDCLHSRSYRTLATPLIAEALKLEEYAMNSCQDL